MSPRRALLTLTLFLGSLLASAQVREGIPMDVASTPLLGDNTIQTHLKLSKDQLAKLKAIFQGYGEWAQKQAQSRPDTAAKMAALQKEANQRQSATGRKALEVLKPEQRARLRQLGLQLYGPFTLLAPDVSQELKITTAQRQKLLAIQSNFRKQVEDLQKLRNTQLAQIPKPKNQSDEKAVKEYMAKAQELVKKFGPADTKKLEAAKKKAEADMLAVLTADQRKRWTQMQGPKFNFVTQRRRG